MLVAPTRFRIHLSTALIVLLAAGVLVGLNMNVEQGRWCAIGTNGSQSGHSLGFPLPWLDSITTVRHTADLQMIGDPESSCRVLWPMALANAVTLLAFLSGLAWLLERRIERKVIRR